MDKREEFLLKLLKWLTVRFMLAPTHLQVIGEELALVWADGSETYLRLEFLRKHCPCAGCAGEPDVLGNVSKPGVSYKETSFRIRSMQAVGGYAIQPTWEDGHTTGLFSYAYLKKLEQEQLSVNA